MTCASVIPPSHLALRKVCECDEEVRRASIDASVAERNIFLFKSHTAGKMNHTCTVIY